MENEDYGERIAIMQYDGHVINAPVKALQNYPSGFVLFAGGEENLEDARAYIKDNGLTQDHVKLVKTENSILVKRR